MVNVNYKMDVQGLGYIVDNYGSITDSQTRLLGRVLGRVLDGGIELVYLPKDPHQIMSALELREKINKARIPLRDVPNLKNLYDKLKSEQAPFASALGKIIDITLAESLEERHAEVRRKFQNSPAESAVL